jgi:hypothetical protein
MLFAALTVLTGATVDPRAILCIPSAPPCAHPATAPSTAIWCNPVSVGVGEKYIISMFQTDAGATDASYCLGRSVTEKICLDLRHEQTFRCDAFWRNGMSGIMGASVDTLKHSVIAKAVALSGPCAATLAVNVTADAFTIL